MDKTEARAARDEGISRAANHADRVEPRWTDRAYRLLHDYALTHERFTTEDVVRHAEAISFPGAPDTRAWGAVSAKAVRERMIIGLGYIESRNRRAHLRPVREWKSKVCQQDGLPELFPVLTHAYVTTLETIDKSKALGYVASWPDREFQQPSSVRVVRYAAEMRNGSWKSTSATISFDRRGRLVDGIHRLLAVIQADATVQMLVARPVATETIS